MSNKTTLKEWVRDLMTNNPIVTPGPTAIVELIKVCTGEIRVERIRMDWWQDEDFRDGYEALRADEGLILMEELHSAGKTPSEVESGI